MGVIQYKLGMAVYGTVLALVGFIATIEAIVLALIGKRFNVDFYVARTFYYLCAPLIGWYIEMEGEENLLNLQATGPAVILGNHQRCATLPSGADRSMVDILYLGRMFPKRAAIMAKKSLKWVPGLGTFSEQPAGLSDPSDPLRVSLPGPQEQQERCGDDERRRRRDEEKEGWWRRLGSAHADLGLRLPGRHTQPQRRTIPASLQEGRVPHGHPRRRADRARRV